ncbi:hypothetical protein BN77_1376 [Rhizobium mesoamericanum STM3625]|uniref:Uncharacterized protein n=1 Tax=Rhizobium mesoamericanum STM3625 TaxID=1211777 RepID=K0PK12_9HYPH|nr:hypothetical protein BN77_1376 [Rhizobium mesoamericanum STM3625]
MKIGFPTQCSFGVSRAIAARAGDHLLTRRATALTSPLVLYSTFLADITIGMVAAVLRTTLLCQFDAILLASNWELPSATS